MTCDRKLLSYYRDGELSLKQRYEVDCHLVACKSCTNDLRGLMRMAQALRSMPMEPVDPRLGQEVRRLVAEREPPRCRPVTVGGLLRGFGPAVVAASVAVSVIVTFRPGALETASPVAMPAPASSSEAPVAAPVDPAPVAAAPVEPTTTAQRPPVGNAVVSDPRDVGTGSTRLGTDRPGSQMAGLPVALIDRAPVPSPIARLYSSNAKLRDLLGEAMPGSRTVTLLEQSFQGGLAIWRSDTREIYVLRRDGNTWSVHPDTWQPGDNVAVDVAPPPGAMVPTAGFGAVWKSTPEVQKRLGWAVYAPRGSGGSIQVFEHGIVVWTPHGLLYVLTDDGRWRTFADATQM
jgi:anti-sigma factor RsiW